MFRISPLASAIAAALSGLAIFAAPAAAAPFSFATAYGQLPKTVVPIAYTVGITPNVTARTIAGTESVRVLVRSATRTVAFNAVNLKLRNVRIDGVPVGAVADDPERQVMTLTLRRTLQPGIHVLSMAYTGHIESGPLGLFAQPYRTSDGRSDVMLSTQFEATDARRMFPCWDEPAFRATYALSATVPARWLTVSNTPVQRRVVHGALATTTFGRTPKMASYLVEFSAGDLARIGARHNGYGFGVVATKGSQEKGRQALANAQTILADYNRYFGYPFPLPKLDSIAVPGGFGGAMENWGAITYNERILLLDANSTLNDRQAVFSVQAHEMAHQWNGDLVTMGWWDDLWLNESFASWMAAKETQARHPEWHWQQREDASKESAMNADARVLAHPIKVHITDALQAETAFDGEITYSKGQAFLRMLEAYLGESTFESGIQRYMRARAFSNATGTDLWNALSSASGRDVASLATTWIDQPGFPLVSETTTCDASGGRTVALSQARFLLDGNTGEAARWQVPLDVRTSTRGPARHVLFTADGQRIAAGKCGDPLSLNAGALGYYRVRYDAPTLADNVKAFAQLPDGDRIALLDDQWALVRDGKAPLSSYLAFASQMRGDDNVRAWSQIADALGSIELDERNTPGYNRFITYARQLLKPLATQLGYSAQYGEPVDRGELRRTVLSSLGEWGDPDVVAYATKRFTQYVNDPASVAPDDRGFILSVVAVNADAATFDKIVALAKRSHSDANLSRELTALASVRDPMLARRALQIAISGTLPPQLASLGLRMVYAAADRNPLEAWAFFTQHFAQLEAPLGPLAIGAIGEATPQVFGRAIPLTQVRAFLAPRTPADLRPKLQNGLARASYDRKERDRLVAATDTFVSRRVADR